MHGSSNSFPARQTHFGRTAPWMKQCCISSVQIFTSTELAAAGLRQAVIDVCLAAHEDNEFRYMFAKYFQSGAWHFLAYDGDTLVQPRGCLDRGVQPKDSRSCAPRSSTAVSTLPSRQNQGYGSATMQRLAEKIGDYEIGCLQTDRTSFYAHLGWEEWRGLLAGRSDDGLIPTPDQRGVMVLRLPNTPPLDLDAELTIERQGERIWE